jgi:hypothetical protein
MMKAIRSPQNFWAGDFYIFLGSAALVIGSDYTMGSAARMGPGYFPRVLAGLLVLTGVIAIARSFTRDGEPIGRIAWKPLALVIGATIAFALLLDRAGLIISLLALCLIGASASARFRFEPLAALGLVGLIAFCALVFVEFFHIPMPLLGSWFGG